MMLNDLQSELLINLGLM